VLYYLQTDPYTRILQYYQLERASRDNLLYRYSVRPIWLIGKYAHFVLIANWAVVNENIVIYRELPTVAYLVQGSVEGDATVHYSVLLAS
jgi:hypothetical protein